MTESADNSDPDNGAMDDGGGDSRTAAATGRNKSTTWKRLLTWVVATVVCALFVAVLPQPRMASGTQLYTNTFAVKLHGQRRDGTEHVDEEVAHQVAKRAGTGFQNVGKVLAFIAYFRWVGGERADILLCNMCQVLDILLSRKVE